MSATARWTSTLLVGLVMAAAGLVGVAGAAAAEPPAPHRCFQADRYGEMPTCTWDGTRWTRSYDGAGAAGASTGPGSGFGALVVLMLLGGMAVTVWKLSTARRMAHDAGMSTRDATAMALLSDDGLEATYLASNLRGTSRPGPAPSPAPSPAPPLADRLRELTELREQGLITTEEHDARRARILDQL